MILNQVSKKKGVTGFPFLPDLRAFRGRVLWAVVWELLFSTTAMRKKHISSKCTVKWKCSFHMGLRVLRWMGLVRKWALSTGMPRTSTSMQGLPLLFPGQTFCPETIWGKTEELWLLVTIIHLRNNSSKKGQRDPAKNNLHSRPPAAFVTVRLQHLLWGHTVNAQLMRENVVGGLLSTNYKQIKVTFQ